MRDNAAEYKSEEIIQFLDSRRIRSHFSTPKEQRLNGAAEPTINSIRMMIARSVMVEPGLFGVDFGSEPQEHAKMPSMRYSRRA